MKAFLSFVATALFLFALSSSASARETRMVHVRGHSSDRVSKGLTEPRTWFVAHGVTEDEVIDFGTRLRESGARAVNIFLPHGVVVCELAAGKDMDRALATPGFFRMSEGAVGPMALSPSGRGLDWIREAYEMAREQLESPAPSVIESDGSFRDVVIPPSKERSEQVRQVLEQARASGAIARLGPAIEERRFNQNSEFLAGTIVAQFVLPESNGSIDADTETWTADDISIAERGAAQAMLLWQGRFPMMDLHFTFKFYEQWETAYEPIQHNMGDDFLWIRDVLKRNVPEIAQLNDDIALAHEFNNINRRGHDWVFTAFIARSQNAVDHLFNNADYTAYANLGGPYMVEPYPAGRDPNSIGEEMVYSQIVQHETGHIFWTLDEYPGAPGACTSRSGYLDWENRNLTVNGPGGPVNCDNVVEDCIMHSAARSNLGSPYCKWSRGQLGVIDDDFSGPEQGVPDVFQSRPIVEFAIAGPETVDTKAYVVRLKAISTAVPNKNPAFGGAGFDYAAPLKDGFFALGGGGGIRVSLTPVDGRWDEIEEDIEFSITLSAVGISSLNFVVENEGGYSSFAYPKVVHFIGVNYTALALDVFGDRIDVSWNVIGGDFGAEYSVYRLGPGATMPGTEVGHDILPAGPPEGGYTPFRFSDRTVEPGTDYRYYVGWDISLDVGGTPRHFVSESTVLSQTAMIPVPAGSIVSNAAPNPFSNETTISLTIPQTFVRKTLGGQVITGRDATAVEVTVFDVAGRRIRKLRESREFVDVLTLRWDGRDLNGRAVPTGIYFVRVNAGSATATRKVVVIR